MDKIVLFTQDQGNFLIRLLIAHIVADFVLQTTKMVENKKWFSIQMGLHILIVFLLTWIFSSSYKIAIIIAISHWLIDSTKLTIQNKNYLSKFLLFVLDQILHILIIGVLWSYKFGIFSNCYEAIKFPFLNYKFSLLLFSYAFVIWPLGYLIKFTLHKMMPQNDTANFEHGGKLIGQFERIIILTFVLLGQYEAIGFLITGKSIIRFAEQNPDVKSEYVLVGTMMSYSLSILTGLGIHWLI